MDERIKQEQLRMLFLQRQIAWSGAFAVTLITVASFWSEYQSVALLSWAVATLAVLFARWFLAKSYDTLSVEQQNRQTRRWRRQFELGALANGCLWGLAPSLFFSDDPFFVTLIIIIHAGYIAGAASSTSVWLPAFLCFAMPASVLFFLGIIFRGHETYWIHGLLVLFYAIIMTLFAVRNNNLVASQIAFRLENIELLADLREQRDRAEMAMMAKNRFLASASHDLRQPVHALGLFVASLESQQGYQERHYILSKIKQTTAALGGLFHGLLDISKLDAKVVENQPIDFALDDLLLLLRDQFFETARMKGLTLRIDTPTDLHALVDPALLERIVTNLVSNAINYTDQGYVEIKTAVIETGEIELSVIDTGRGIPASEHENIFSEYHQLENPERNRQKGLGLGLAIVHRLCALMSVPIKVASSPGQGSCFTIKLLRGEQPTVTRVDEALELVSQGINVVVIDDETDILEGMHKILTNWGCRAVPATSTVEALAALQDYNLEPDIIVADFRLKGEDSGLEAISAIREEYNWEIPSILVTGDTAPERLQQAAKASVKVLHKPVEPNQLKSMLRQFVNVDQETTDNLISDKSSH